MPDDRAAPSAPADEAAARAADHAGIDRLIDRLVPSLVAQLGTLNVGELEVREGDWRIRLRRPIGAGPNLGRRATDRPGGRAHPGGDSLGAPAPARPAHATPGTPAPGGSPGGSADPDLAASGQGRADGHDGPVIGDGHDPARVPMATSPAVGIFQPGPKAVAGTRVRAGDRLGVVEMLGIPHDVAAPVDGIVIGVLADAGTVVEYGQELVQVEPAVIAPALVAEAR